jgi:hypothetical protein
MSDDLSETISQLAASYDPDREQDGLAVRAILQGAMMMSAGLDGPTPPLKSLVKIRDVEQDRDRHGDYLPYYTIVTASGHRIRVTLELET